jgi:hypothetical protein
MSTLIHIDLMTLITIARKTTITYDSLENYSRT